MTALSLLDSARFLRGKAYGINQQFPQEIEQARRSLYPIMKQMRSEGKQVKLVRDMLFVDGELYNPHDISDVSDYPQSHSSHTDAHLAAWGLSRSPERNSHFELRHTARISVSATDLRRTADREMAGSFVKVRTFTVGMEV